MINKKINKHGFWIGDDNDFIYSYDKKLSLAILKFFKKERVKRVVDFGCGKGEYIKFFLDKGIKVKGYDGNPYTKKITNGLGEVLDLAIRQDLKNSFEWVISLEVGEHIPEKYENVFIDNLIRHCEKGIILSWAISGQGGEGHFNEKDNESVKNVFFKKKFLSDISLENFFRKNASLWYFKNTIMVFRKIL